MLAVLPEQQNGSILGRHVLGQTKPGIQACILINKEDDDWLRNAQRALSEAMRGEEEAAAGNKGKQAVMDEILTPCFGKSSMNNQ